jgi:hypothetical protein
MSRVQTHFQLVQRGLSLHASRNPSFRRHQSRRQLGRRRMRSLLHRSASHRCGDRRLQSLLRIDAPGREEVDKVYTHPTLTQIPNQGIDVCLNSRIPFLAKHRRDEYLGISSEHRHSALRLGPADRVSRHHLSAVNWSLTSCITQNRWQAGAAPLPAADDPGKSCVRSYSSGSRRHRRDRQ